MEVSRKMIDQICLFETAKKFGHTLSSSELHGVYVKGDAIKTKHKTFGYGLLYHPNGKQFMDQVKSSFTQKEIESLYIETINSKGKKILSQISKPLTQDQFDALVCVSYNFGSVPKTLLSLINVNPNDAKIHETWIHLSDAQYKKYGNKVKGLLNRRKLEADWYAGKHN